VTAKLGRAAAIAGVIVMSTALASCNSFIRDGRSPARLVILTLQGASGAQPDKLSGTVSSDVETIITSGGNCTTTSPCPTTFSDPGAVEMVLQLRDIGDPKAPSEPSPLNAVTINRYNVSYRRADGRNTPGVDVPYPFESAVTITVPDNGSAKAGFDLVRNIAKHEAPLAALVTGETLITTIADVTFYGRDLAGNDVSVTGSIGVTFGNFGDPQ